LIVLFINLKILFQRVYSKKIDEILPKNLLEDIYTAAQQKQLGIIYDKRPFKILLEKDKKYNWCSCGMSRQQVCTDLYTNLIHY